MNRNTGNLIISYEEMVTKRQCVIRKIASLLDLPAPKKMMVRSKKASGSTVISSKKNQSLLHAGKLVPSEKMMIYRDMY